ncbi:MULTISPECIES: hypothetical protein [Thermoleptolyngbya]|nr:MULTISPECIES: hypothetical protein [Thermoleptolyngbya]
MSSPSPERRSALNFRQQAGLRTDVRTDVRTDAPAEKKNRLRG